jgi:hypothetical protein
VPLQFFSLRSPDRTAGFYCELPHPIAEIADYANLRKQGCLLNGTFDQANIRNQGK